MICIRSYYFGILDRIKTWFWNIGRRCCSQYGIVLMYHHVTDEDINIDASCRCSSNKFQTTLIRLKKEGYTFVSMDDAYGFLNHKPNQKFAVVSFDDVPADVLENAIPFLRMNKIPYTLFITVSYTKQQGYISESQLMELSLDPLCTIGAHTMTHPMLRNVANSFEEMKYSKEYLEYIIKRRIDYLAYPFGKYSSISLRVRKQAKQVGFKCAFGTINAPITAISKTDLFFLPRIIS